MTTGTLAETWCDSSSARNPSATGARWVTQAEGKIIFVFNKINKCKTSSDMERFKWLLFSLSIFCVATPPLTLAPPQVFEGTDACVTPVLNIEELASSPLHRHRQSFSPTADDPSEVLPNPAPRLSSSPALPTHREGTRPVMGQHSKEVLRELGYGEQEVEKLVQEGVVEEGGVRAKL